MKNYKKAFDILINSHGKQLFSLDEVAELCGGFISKDYNLYVSDCNSYSRLVVQRMNIYKYFEFEELVYYNHVDKTFRIRKPNHYVVISECKCDYYITHAGILLLLSDLNKFKVSDSELECIENSQARWAKKNFN